MASETDEESEDSEAVSEEPVAKTSLDAPARIAMGQPIAVRRSDGGWLTRGMGHVAAIVDERPGMVVTVLLVITVALLHPAYQTLQNTNTNANDAFLPDADIVRVQEEIGDHFQQAAPFITVLEAKDGNILSRESLLASEAIIAELQGIEALSSKLDPNAPGRGMLTASSLVNLTLFFMGSNLQSANDSTLEMALRATFSADNPAGLGILSTDYDPNATELSAHYTMMLIQLDPQQFRPEDLAGPGNEDVNAIDQILHNRMNKEVETDGLETHGLVGWTEEFEGGAEQGLSLILVSIIIVLTILLVTVRSVLDLSLAAACIGVTFVWMAGITGVLGITINTLSYFAPLLVLALGVDYAIVLLTRQREGRMNGQSASSRIRETMTHAGSAVLLSMLTTFIAFISNVFSSIAGLRQFGSFLAIGIFGAFVAMGILLPTLQHLVSRSRERRMKALSVANGGDPSVILAGSPHDPTRVHVAEQNIFAMGARVAHERPIWVAVGTIAVLIVSVFGATQLESSFDVRDFLSDESPLLDTFTLLEEEFAGSGGAQSLRILVKGDVATVDQLSATREYLVTMREAPLVGTVPADDPALQLAARSIYHHVVAFTSDAGRVENLSVNVTLDANGVPTTDAGVEAVFDALTTAGYTTAIGPVTPDDVRGVLQWDNTTGEYQRALILIDYSGEGSAQRPLQESGEENLKIFAAAGFDAGLTGEQLVFLALSDAIVDTMGVSIIITLVLCLVILMVTLRSPLLGVLTTIPVLIVTLGLFGFMFFAGYTLNLLTVLIAAISIGVGVDFSIHITRRFLEARDDGLPIRRALDISMGTTGRALTAAALSSTLGFCVLLIADLQMFQTFGGLAAMMTALALFGAVLVLPSLLKFWASRFDSDHEAPEGLDSTLMPTSA